MPVDEATQALRDEIAEYKRGKKELEQKVKSLEKDLARQRDQAEKELKKIQKEAEKEKSTKEKEDDKKQKEANKVITELDRMKNARFFDILRGIMAKKEQNQYQHYFKAWVSSAPRRPAAGHPRWQAPTLASGPCFSPLSSSSSPLLPFPALHRSKTERCRTRCRSTRITWPRSRR